MDESENNVLNLLKQVVAVFEQNNISDGQIMKRTGNKYSKPTISNFKHLKSTNPNLETFVDMCMAAEITIRLETDQSVKAETMNEIEEYRLKYAEKCVECESLKTKNADMMATVNKIIETNEKLADTNGKLASTNGRLAEGLLGKM